MDINIKLVDIAKLTAAFRKAPIIAVAEYDKAIERSAFKIEALAKRNAPVNKQSGGGNLRQLISSKITGKASAVIESKAKYSAYVDQGTRPHIIRARNAKVLANKRTGQFFGKVVKHPGTRAQPFFTNAIEEGVPYLNEQLKIAMNNIFKTIH